MIGAHLTYSANALLETLMKLSMSLLCSIIISFEREFHTHPGGIATHALVGLGSCLFTMISIYLRENLTAPNADPARICAQVVNGIGFLGSATVFKSNNYVKGINTAANIWIAAATSMAIGAGMWEMALITSLFAAAVLAINNCYKKRLYARMQAMKEESEENGENPFEYIDLENLTGHKDSLATVERDRAETEQSHSKVETRKTHEAGFLEMTRFTNIVKDLVMAQVEAADKIQSKDGGNASPSRHEKSV